MRAARLGILGLIFVCATGAYASDLDSQILGKIDADHQSEIRSGAFAARKTEVQTRLAARSPGRTIASAEDGGIEARERINTHKVALNPNAKTVAKRQTVIARRATEAREARARGRR